MKMKRMLTMLLAVLMILGAASACGVEDVDSQTEPTPQQTLATEPETEATDPVVTEPAVECEYTLASGCAVYVHGRDGSGYSDFTLHISGANSFSVSLTPSAQGVCTVELEPGVYAFTLVNNADAAQVKTFTVLMDDEGEQDLVIATEFEAPAPVQTKMELSADDRYRINIFLSNFSEQDFCERYQWNGSNATLIPTYLDTATADPMELIEFAWLYAKINQNACEDVVKDGHYYYGVDLQRINSLTVRFFDRTVGPSDVQTGQFDEIIGYSWILIDGKVCSPAADGETYNRLTVVENMYDLGDGTMRADFHIFEIDLFSAPWELIEAGSVVLDKDVYCYTYDKIQSMDYYIPDLRGSAVVRPFTTDNGRETYQLISYELIAQE